MESSLPDEDKDAETLKGYHSFEALTLLMMGVLIDDNQEGSSLSISSIVQLGQFMFLHFCYFVFILLFFMIYSMIRWPWLFITITITITSIKVNKINRQIHVKLEKSFLVRIYTVDFSFVFKYCIYKQCRCSMLAYIWITIIFSN